MAYSSANKLETTPLTKCGNYGANCLNTPIFFSSSEDDSISALNVLEHNVVKKKVSKLRNTIKNISVEQINTGTVVNSYIHEEIKKDDGVFEVLSDDDENLSFPKSSCRKFIKCWNGSSDNSYEKNDINDKVSCRERGTLKLDVSNNMNDLTNSLTSLSISKRCIMIPQKIFQPIIWDSDDSVEEILVTDKVPSKSIKKSFLQSLSLDISEEQADEEALKYRNNFKIHKYELSEKLFHLFNEKIFCNKLPKDMTINWNDRLLSTAGYCSRSFNSNGKSTCSIALSTTILTSALKLRDTLLHEMCHAAVWIISGIRDGHGPLWQSWALRCKIVFPEIEVPTRCHTYEIAYKYTYKCVKCNKKIGRNKKIDILKKCCAHCKGKFQLMK